MDKCEHQKISVQVVDMAYQGRFYEVVVCSECGKLINDAASGEMSPAEIVQMFEDLRSQVKIVASAARNLQLSMRIN